MKPLYLYKLTEKGLKRYIVEDYIVVIKNSVTGVYKYCFTAQLGTKSSYHYVLWSSKLDRFSWDKLWTFNSNEDYAVDLIKKHLINKIEYQEDKSKYRQKLSLLVGVE